MTSAEFDFCIKLHNDDVRREEHELRSFTER